MLVTRLSPVTGNINSMELEISADQVRAFRSGALIQDAMPNLNHVEREFFLTGMTEEDWKETFGDDEEEPTSAP